MYKTKISVYPSCLSTLVHNDVTLSEVYDKIKNDDVLRQRTVNYRKAIEAKLPAKQLKKLKAEQFPMLMPAARFKEGRDMEHLDSYTGLCQCDIDNIPPDMMDEAKRRVRSLPFVCMYHVSMSGKGLHIYYFYQIPNEGLTPQVYQQAFIQGNECIGKAIPADYDAAVGKANHGSSICHGLIPTPSRLRWICHCYLKSEARTTVWPTTLPSPRRSGARSGLPRKCSPMHRSVSRSQLRASLLMATATNFLCAWR